MDYSLKHSLCTVEKPDGGLTRGGSQSLSASKSISLAGCGIVGAAELLIYLSRNHGFVCPGLLQDVPFKDTISAENYDTLLKKIASRYLPIIPRAGINGAELAAGVNLIFKKYSVPLRARWGIGTRGFYEDIESMLIKDIPVIISVGPNVPKFWGNDRVDLYSMRGDGELEKSTSVKAHYMIVTGLDGERIKVSSWGQEFYILRSDYDNYVKQHSSSIVCNILHIDDRK